MTEFKKVAPRRSPAEHVWTGRLGGDKVEVVVEAEADAAGPFHMFADSGSSYRARAFRHDDSDLGTTVPIEEGVTESRAVDAALEWVRRRGGVVR